MTIMKKQIHTINPATGKTLASYLLLTNEELDRKLLASSVAFHKWKKTDFDTRGNILRRVAELLIKNKVRYAKMITAEMGKTIRESIAEVEKSATVCTYYADHAEEFLKEELIASDATRSSVRFEPLGIIFAIMPWNFPFWQVFRAAAPSLMAGNAVVLKHASNVPGCSLLIEEIFTAAKLPSGVFQSLLIDSSQSERVIAYTDVRAVTLTGSEGAGMAVAKAAGNALKKVVLELGGSDPFIVLEDADVEAAATTAVTARLIATGQSCIAAKRFIVHKKVADRFTKRFIELLEAKKIGDPTDPTTDVGALANEQILATIEGQVKSSLRKGAVLLTGGKRIGTAGYFYAPTVLTNVTDTMPVMYEETFGPVAALTVVENDTEALRIANNTRYGLGSSLWTKNKKKMEKFISELNAGSVFINGMVKSDPRLPFGGTKMSGYGRELSSYGIREFVNVKTVWISHI